MTTTRADKYTIESKKVEYYSDFMPNLDKNPITGYLARVTNEDSIIQSMKLLLLTERTERYFQPWIGSKINGLLFEPSGPLTNIALEDEIKMTLTNGEPRVNVEKIVITNGQTFDDTDISVSITFTINNVPNQSFTTDIILNRLR